MDVHNPAFRPIACVLIGVLFLNPLLSTAAELAVDGSATSVTHAANGVPIVNIAAPNSSGLSHNRFTDYNVGQQGLILNNGTAKFVESQLGGVILGNSQLGGRAAGLILNEVTGGNPSQLRGYTEVAGQRAHVVVANPHGITCDGCGFINTPRVSLSTGSPVIEDGQLKRFDVDGGQIVIDGAGLNAANVSQFDLITRTAMLNAALYADQLNVITGRNAVDAATLAVTAKTEDGRAKPSVSIDSSALGGMYAGAIRLVGTEAGVGVKLAGDMAASGGDIQIDTRGKLTVARVVSAGGLRVNAEQIELTDKAHADGAVQVVARGAVEVGKSLTSAAQVSVQAASIINRGTLGGAGAVKLEAPVLVNQGGLIFSGQGMVLRADTFTNRRGDVYSLGALDIAATQQIDNRSGTLESAGNLKLQAKRINNGRDVLTTRQEKYAAQITELPCTAANGAGDCDGGKENQVWRILERDRLLVTDASVASFITAGGNLNVMAGSLLNHASAISAAGNLTINTDTLQNIGIQPGEYENSRVFISSRTRNPESLRAEAAAFNGVSWPQTEDPLGLVVALNSFLGRLEFERPELRTTTVLKADGDTYSAIIQAGGKVDVTTQNSFDSSVVRPTYAYVSGGSLGTTEMAGGAIATAVSHNPQLSPDLSQQVVLPGFNLPTGNNGLFHLNTGGKHGYLVETNPAFASLRGFLSSDYLLGIIGYNKDLTRRRLGDGLYEQRLIQQAVIARTGKRFLDGLTTDDAQFRYLMDNAIASKQALNLTPGIALNAEQAAALTHDIVWMQEQEVAGQKVLVPVLYLAQAKDRLAPTGALIQGTDVALISGGALTNSGTLRASKNLSVSAENITNSGLMQADQNVSLLATDSIRNTRGGLIIGNNVSAIALNGDITNERSVTTHQSAKSGLNRHEDFIDSAAGIEASNNLVLSAGRDLLNQGGNLQAGSDATLTAGQDLLITSQTETDSAASSDRNGHSTREQTTQHSSSITAGGTLTAEAGRDLAVIASTAKAGSDIKLSAANDLTIASAANQTSSDSYRKSAGKTVTAQTSSTRQQSAVIDAGRNINIDAGNTLILSASQLKAANEAYFYAGNQLALLSAEDTDHALYDKKTKGSWGAKETKKDETTNVRHIGTQIETGGDLTLISEGDQLYQKASLKSGADLTLDSGGAITFEAVKDLKQESHERSKSDWAWNSAEGEGTTDETLRQSDLMAKGETIIRAVDGIHIDIKHVDQQSVSQTINAMVAADPNLAWIKEAEKRGDVDWRRVKEVHDSWDYKSSGLGMGAALIIAIVVTVLTAGAASAAIGGLAGATAGSGTAMAAGAGAAAAGAGNIAATAVATSVASTAAVSTLNNKGNLGKTFQDITSADNLKNYITAGVTAGILAGFVDPALGGKTNPTNGTVQGFDLSKLGDVAGLTGHAAASAVVQAGVGTAIKGGSFSDNLQGALKSQLQGVLQAVAFNAVGDYSQDKWDSGSPQKVALHALVGGLLSKASGGDFATGAAAAGANELLIKQLDGLVASSPELLVAASQIVGIAAAGITDGDAQLGADIAKSATSYNYLLHHEVEEMLAEQDRCSTQTCLDEVRERYAQKDEQRNTELSAVCQQDLSICTSLSKQLLDDAPKIEALVSRLRREGKVDSAVVVGWLVAGSNQMAQDIVTNNTVASNQGALAAAAGVAAELLASTVGGIKPTASKKLLTQKDFPPVSVKISQKQLRHIGGRPELAAREGGGYLSSVADAQKVLDAYHAGQVKILGKNPQGFPVVKFGGVTGTNVNLGAGINSQPTNIFMIKGTKSPSVVPLSPKWRVK